MNTLNILHIYDLPCTPNSSTISFVKIEIITRLQISNLNLPNQKLK